jgi:hypothetical protein
MLPTVLVWAWTATIESRLSRKLADGMSNLLNAERPLLFGITTHPPFYVCLWQIDFPQWKSAIENHPGRVQ